MSGESHYYLGKQYQLKVTEAQTLPQKVKMLRGCLEVTVRHKSAEKVKSLLADWYRAGQRGVSAPPRYSGASDAVGQGTPAGPPAGHADPVGELLCERLPDT